MKKLFAVLLTLCLALSLPLFVLAEEPTTSETPEGTAAAETATETATAETPDETAPVESDPNESEPTETESNESETETESNESEAETAYKMNIGFYPETLLNTLPVMGMGMLGIFLVTCVIVLAVVILSKLGGKDKEE